MYSLLQTLDLMQRLANVERWMERTDRRIEQDLASKAFSAGEAVGLHADAAAEFTRDQVYWSCVKHVHPAASAVM